MLQVGVHHNQDIYAMARKDGPKALADGTSEPTLALAWRAMDHRDRGHPSLPIFAQQVDRTVVRVVHEDQAPFAVAEGVVQFVIKLNDVA